MTIAALALVGALAFGQAPVKTELKTHTPSQREGSQLLQKRQDRSRGFIENIGQWPADALFLGRSSGLDVWVAKDGFKYDCYVNSGTASSGHVVGMHFVGGAKTLAAVGRDDKNIKTDFMGYGKDVKGARTFKNVVASNLYPGVSMHSYFDGTRPRYDLIVAPKADPGQIQIKVVGSNGIEISRDKLSINTSIGQLVQNDLVAYQIIDGKKKVVPAAFKSVGKDTVAFKLGAYDHSKQLVIDPIVYGSYYGGDSGMDEVHAVAADLQGGVYMTGSTRAIDFPAIYGPYSLVLRGPRDAYVSKLEGDVYRHDYAVYLGGTKDESGEFLQLDQFGNLWVTGYTNSQDFPGSGYSNIQYLRYDQFGSAGKPIRHNGQGTPSSGYSRPNTTGRFRMRFPSVSGQFTDYMTWDASPAVVQATLQAYFNLYAGGAPVTVTGSGTLIDDPMGFRIVMPATLKGEFEVDNAYLGAVYGTWVPSNNVNAVQTYVATRIGTGTHRAQVLMSDPEFPTRATAGTYRIQVSYRRTGNPTVYTTKTVSLNFDATAGVVAGALATIPPAAADPDGSPVFPAGSFQLVPANQTLTGTMPAQPYLAYFNTDQFPLSVVDMTLDVPYIFVDTKFDVISKHPQSSIPSGPADNVTDPNPNGGGFNVTYDDDDFADRAARWNADRNDLYGRLSLLLGTNDVMVLNTALPTRLPFGQFSVFYVENLVLNFVPPLHFTFDQIIVGAPYAVLPPGMSAEGRLDPRPRYTVESEYKCFAMRFKQDASTELSPQPTKTYFFGGAVAPRLSGFQIVPHNNPTLGEPIRMVFAGTANDTNQIVPQVPTTPRVGVPSGFILRVNFTDAAGFSVMPGSLWVDSLTYPVDIAGMDVDPNGNVYVAGTIKGHKGDTIDTSISNEFPTTPVDAAGTMRDSRLLRDWDGYARKYGPNGNLVYSILIGGNAADEGFGIAVDLNQNAYVVGRSSSFNYPRTHGVFGETFTQALVTTVVKLNTGATDAVYATHLRTSGDVTPVGIAVDGRSNAYVSGIVSRNPVIPNLSPLNDPNMPVRAHLFVGSIPLSGDAYDTSYNQQNNPDIGSTEAFLLGLNSSATGLIYGSYLGGDMDERIYPPYVDDFGDVWVCGWTDTFQAYIRPRTYSRGLVRFKILTRLPAGLITSLAFRPVPDPNIGLGGSGTTLVPWQLYDAGQSSFPFTFSKYLDRNGMRHDTSYDFWSTWDAAFGGFTPYFYNSYRDRDGFVNRYRFGAASISNVTFNPATIPGGLGASTTGTVTLSEAAPAGGATVTLTISANAPGSFDPGSNVTSTTIVIPANGTAGGFRVYSQPVSDNTPVDVRATYQGSFKIGRVVVTPWLQSFTVTPPEVVGGNVAIGRIQLAAPAGTAGMNVTITSDKTSVVPITSVTVPPGQTVYAFNITTNGVDVDTTVTLNASLLGVGKAVQLVVHPVQLKSMSFDPSPVTSGTSSTGTLVLNGKAGPGGFSVQMAVQGSPAGYTITPAVLTFASGEVSKTFVVATPYENSTVPRVIRATMLPTAGYTPNSITATLNVVAAAIVNLSVTPNPIDGGATGTGQVTISTPALKGGALVDVSVTPAGVGVIVPAHVAIAGGQTAATFTVLTSTRINDATFTIKASRGASSASVVLTVRKLTFTLTTPGTLAGGDNGTGTVTLSGPAPAGGITVQLTSTLPSVLSVPATVQIAAGATLATFPITTVGVAADVTVDVSARISSVTHTNTIAVRAARLANLTLNPTNVLNLNTTLCTLTMDGPASSAGYTVTLTNSNKLIANVPTSVTIPAGKTTFSFTISTMRVTRTLTTNITASGPNGGSGSAVLTVHN